MIGIKTESTITIFNRRRMESGNEVLVPTVIRNCTWYYKHIVSGSEMMDNADEYSVRIPIDAIFQDRRKYIDGIGYSNLSDEAVKGYWTIQKNDMVVRGEYTETINQQSVIAQQTEDRFIVSTFGNNTWRGSNRVKHWRAGGS